MGSRKSEQQPESLRSTQEQERRIGPYRLLECLGRGADGIVYRAEHRETGECHALKTVRVPRTELLLGIQREIHALARVRHPGVVRVLDQGVEGGEPWFAMELVEGSSLLEHSRGGWDPLGPAALTPHGLRGLLTTMRRLCSPLACLHGLGLVHGDLKPDNVLVRPDGTPVLVDFGLSSHFAAELSREILEPGGPVAGTVSYMAPEVVQGDFVDARADLYSLGCILHELLAGRPPFEGQTAQEVLRKHLEEPPPRLSERVRGLPSELEALVLELLAKQPRERIGHADLVAAALEKLGAQNGGLHTGLTPRAYLYRPGFAGRDKPMQAFERLLEKLRSTGGRLVLIRGESGVGKTRLLMELSRRARQRGFRVLTGECEPPAASKSSAGSPAGAALQALRKPLQAVVSWCRERGPAETVRLLGRRGPILAPYEPSILELPGHDAGQEPAALPAEAARLRLVQSLAETLAAFSEERPALLLLDDLQWADELMLSLLELLLRGGQLERGRLLLVGAYRAEEASPALLRLHGLPGALHPTLERLDPEALGSIVSDMLALRPPPEPLVRFLDRHSEGNPFFVAEYLRAAVGEGLLYRDEAGRWQLTAGAEEAVPVHFEQLPLPLSLRDLVGRRMAGLTRSTLGLAQAAAVLGREFSTSLLAEAGELAGAALFEALEELLRRQVLETPGPGVLRFVHDKIREVAYEQIDPDGRRMLHCAAATAIEAQPAAYLDKHLAALGHHWQLAGQNEKARPCYLAAAHQAAARYQHGAAERLYRAYLGLVDRPTPESIEARNKMGEMLSLQGMQSAALEEHRLALDEARQLQGRREESQSLRLIAVLCSQSGQLDEARSYLEQSLTIARESGWPEEAAMNLVNLAVVHGESGRPQESRALYQEALKLLDETGDQRSKGVVLGNLAILIHDEGQLEDATALYQQALAIHRELGNRRIEAMTLSNLAGLRGEQGRFEEARTLHEQALAIKREIGDRRSEGVTLSNLAIVYQELGQPAEARAFLDQALAIHRQVLNLREEGVALCEYAILERRNGRLEEARRHIEQAEQLLQQVEQKYHQALSICERGHIAVAAGQAARAALDQAQEFATQLAAGPPSLLGRAVSKLRHAIEAFEAGEHHRLFRGELVEDLPETLRRRGADARQAL